MRKIAALLQEKLATLISSMGYEFWGYEQVSMGRQTIFRLYIDASGGVTLDDCTKVSHQVSAMLDVMDIIEGRYLLEVSSPGIDRPLFELAHYRKVIGKRVKIRLQSAISKRRQYTGIVQHVTDDDIILMVDGLEEEIKLPFSVIEKANLVEDR